MSKKDLTPKEEIKQKKTMERLKALISGEYGISGMTRSALAIRLGIGESSVRGYMNGRQILSDKVAEKLEDYTGIPAAFWMGETDLRSMDEYKKSLVTSGKAAVLDQQIEKTVRRRKDFFSRLGYEYRYEGSAVWDFFAILPQGQQDQILSDLSEAPLRSAHHSLTCRTGEDPLYLSEAELSDLEAELRSFMDYQIFKLKGRNDQ